MKSIAKFTGILISTFAFLAAASPVRAVCPVCTVAVVAGLEISRMLGIDDIVTSLWIGGLVLSSSFWLIDWVNKKWPQIEFKKWAIPVIVSMYLLVFIPLKLNGSIGIAGNSLWGVDKILLGTGIGSLVFVSGVFADKKVRQIRGSQMFQFQRVVFPVMLLVATSVLFYGITKS